MAKARTIFYCTNCGNESSQWSGKCSSCNEWNTLKEKVLEKSIATHDRREVTNEMYKEIELIFQTFINSINDEDLRSQALKYFFEREDELVADIRHPESLLNFDEFNDIYSINNSNYVF